MKREHRGEPAFPCSCGRNFPERKGLARHQNSCVHARGHDLQD